MKGEKVSTHCTRFKHDLHISFNHRSILQADDCCVITHIRKYLTKRINWVKRLKLFNPVVWICECVTDLPCSSPAWHTHTQTPALFSQLSWPWNRYHYLYQHLSRSRGRKKKAHMCHCWWCSYKRTWFRFSSLPAMEWIRMLLILRLFGGGSCLLNLFFMIS